MVCSYNKGQSMETWLKLPLLYVESTWHNHTPVSKTDLFPASDYRVGHP